MNHKHWKNLIIVLGLLMSAIVVVLQAQSTVHAVPNQRGTTNLIYDTKPGSESSQLTPAAQPETAVLSPDALDPPESCGVPLRGPFGQDVEILVGPWANNRITHQLSLNPVWKDQQPLSDSTPNSNIATLAQSVEQIVATWVNSSGSLFYNTWHVSSGWSGTQSLNQMPDSNPALLSRNAYNWVVFTRLGDHIQYREWNHGTLGDWLDLPGIVDHTGAASDPIVISKDPNHMAVFYRDEDGAVWFTEGVLGGEVAAQSIQAPTQEANTIWRSKPVSLSGIEEDFDLYLPLVMKNSSAGSFVQSEIVFPIAATPRLEASDIFTLTSELSVASRSENHLAVFGVDADNQLWVKEWTNRNASDWHDTEWVKLMEDVVIERPSVTSRHSNHLGLTVRDTSGEPWYIEWTYAASWKTPISLGGTRSSPLTIAAPRIDALSVFSVGAGQIWYKEWNEAAGWGDWQVFADTNAQNGQALAAASRQLDDLMLLGRHSNGTGFYKHFTFLGQELEESEVAPGSPVSAHPGDQALAWVDGQTLWVGADQDQATMNTWEVEVLALSDGATTSLALPQHPWAGWTNQRSAIAAGDIDFDGDDEIVIATAADSSPTFSISVLDLSISPSLQIELTTTVTRDYTAAIGPADGRRLDVAIGDLDGDGRQAEVAVTYQLKTAASDYYQPSVSLFEFVPATGTLAYRGQQSFAYQEPTSIAWEPTGNMYNDHYFRHTATLLPNGDVLVVGDGDDWVPTATEIYHPAAGSWSLAGDLNTARYAHTATLLPDGRVLVAGGECDGGCVVSSEIFSPTLNTWSPTGNLNTMRSDHTATLLPDGRVLVVGGYNSGFLSSAEVYDPATGSWSPTGDLHIARSNHIATLLPDGRVLVAGGLNLHGNLTSAEVYDPATGSWSLTGDLNTARSNHTATLLPDGRVLVVGGGNSGFLASAEVYDPATGSWSFTGNLNTARTRHTATLLPDGHVLVAGGLGNGGYFTSAEVYNPATGSWSPAGDLNTARWNHTATPLLDGRVLVVGGFGDGGYLTSAEVYETGLSRDVRTSIGQVFDRHPVQGRLSGEQLIVAASYDVPYPSWESNVHTKVYSMTVTGPDWSFVELDAIDVPGYSSSSHPWIALDTGDLNADGLEEIVTARSGAAYLIDYDQAGNRVDPPAAYGGVSNDNITLAVGDFDLDGKAEIAYWTEGNRVEILDMVDEDTLLPSGSIAPLWINGELLSGDLDGDSFQAELAGCSDFSEISVIAVLNGAPRLYAGGLPVQDTDVRYAKTASGGSSSAWGTTTNLGGFFSVGFEVEINVPLIGTKLGEVRGSVTQDFMASQGQTQTVEESVTLSSGYNNASGQTLGIVVYNGIDYRCYYYDVYASAAPEQTSRAMICQPLGNTYEHYRSLEQWHSDSFKQEAGASWVDVGHRTAGGVRTNEVNTYPSGLPIDPYLLKQIWNPTQPFRVDYDVSGGYTDWSITQMGGGAQETSQSFETNTTTSAGVTAGNVTVDAGFTFGFGWDKSRAVSWSNELEIGGSVYLNSNPAFASCVYTVVPYIYHAKATSQAGITYPYLEMDYYVPSLTGNCSPLSSTVFQ